MDPSHEDSSLLERALPAVLDAIVPPAEDGSLPGAGELGLALALARIDGLAASLAPGLAALEEAARARGAADFAALPLSQRFALLKERSERDPGFLPGLVFHTYVHYYQHPRVLEALGLEPRAPHPLGYALEPADLSLLEPVRGRGRIYRETAAPARTRRR